MRKRRTDSVLGMLPEERQAQIAEHAHGHTLEETRQWLAEDGVKTSRAALSLWLSDFRLRQTFRLAEGDAITFIDLLRKKRPGLSESELTGWANEFFQMQAVKLGDPRTFLQFATARHNAEMDRLNFEQRERGLKQREEALKLEREKFEFDAAGACLAKLPELKTIAANPKLSQSAKIAAIRERLFGVVPTTGEAPA
jgi:hypothetical protein